MSLPDMPLFEFIVLLLALLVASAVVCAWVWFTHEDKETIRSVTRE